MAINPECPDYLCECVGVPDHVGPSLGISLGLASVGGEGQQLVQHLQQLLLPQP